MQPFGRGGHDNLGEVSALRTKTRSRFIFAIRVPAAGVGAFQDNCIRSVVCHGRRCRQNGRCGKSHQCCKTANHARPVRLASMAVKACRSRLLVRSLTWAKSRRSPHSEARSNASPTCATNATSAANACRLPSFRASPSVTTKPCALATPPILRPSRPASTASSSSAGRSKVRAKITQDGRPSGRPFCLSPL